MRLTMPGTLGAIAALLAICLGACAVAPESEDHSTAPRLFEPDISAEMPYQKQMLDIGGVSMAYIDIGEGDPIVFLHGNPTSSYLWRNIMPALEGRGRLIAPDLVGMGDSAKLGDSGPDSYTFETHAQYLYALLDALGVDGDVTLVLHDWGSALGFNWAYRNPEKIKAIVFMEAIVAPIPSFEAMSPGGRRFFQALRSADGERLVLQDNFFVLQGMSAGMNRKLTGPEWIEYIRPFDTPGESRRPTHTWPNQVPIGGEPADVAKIVTDYGAWLATSDVPKLWINAEPGTLITGPVRGFVRTWPNVTEMTVNSIHYVQEDHPQAISEAIAAWLPQ